MKSRIKAERLAEFTARRGEFASYLDFINARVKESPAARELLAVLQSRDADVRT
jgi:hypothetical protein